MGQKLSKKTKAKKVEIKEEANFVSNAEEESVASAYDSQACVANSRNDEITEESSFTVPHDAIIEESETEDKDEEVHTRKMAPKTGGSRLTIIPTAMLIENRITKLFSQEKIVEKTEIDLEDTVIRLDEHFLGKKLVNSFLKSLDESDRKRDNINTFAVSFCMNLLSLGVIQTLEDQEIQSDKFELNILYRWTPIKDDKVADLKPIFRETKQHIDLIKSFPELCQNCKNYIECLDDVMRKSDDLEADIQVKRSSSNASEKRKSLGRQASEKGATNLEVLTEIPTITVEDSSQIKPVANNIPKPPVMASGGPPPPPGMFAMKPRVYNKKPIAPLRKMKPLFWDRVLTSPTDEKSVWAQIDEVNLDNLNEFVDAFQAKQDSKLAVALQKDTQVSLLDGNRIRNIAIISKNMPVCKIQKALYNFCFNSGICADDLTKIEVNRATEDEIEKFSNVKDYQTLDASERWLLDLMHVNCLLERIFCMKTQAQFEESIEEISHNLKLVNSVCEFFTQNEDLKKLLSIILTFGNYMNGGNANKGQADGFGLKVLGKLKDVKSNDPKMSLLHFVVNTYINNGGNEMKMLSHVEECKDCDFNSYVEKIRMVKNKLKECRSNLDVILEKSEVCTMIFEQKLKEFLLYAEYKLINVEKMMANSQEIFKNTADFYNFKVNANEKIPGQFFELWASFANDFSNIYKQKMEEKLTLSRRKRSATPGGVELMYSLEELKGKISRSPSKYLVGEE